MFSPRAVKCVCVCIYFGLKSCALRKDMSSSYDKVHLPLDLCLRLYVHARCKRDTHQQTHITRESTIFAHTTVCVCVCLCEFQIGMHFVWFCAWPDMARAFIEFGVESPRATHTEHASSPPLWLCCEPSALLFIIMMTSRTYVCVTHSHTHTHVLRQRHDSNDTRRCQGRIAQCAHRAKTIEPPPSIFDMRACVCARV